MRLARQSWVDKQMTQRRQKRVQYNATKRELNNKQLLTETLADSCKWTTCDIIHCKLYWPALPCSVQKNQTTFKRRLRLIFLKLNLSLDPRHHILFHINFWHINNKWVHLLHAKCVKNNCVRDGHVLLEPWFSILKRIITYMHWYETKIDVFQDCATMKQNSKKRLLIGVKALNWIKVHDA